MASYEPLSAIATEQQLEERLSRPDESVCQTMAQMEGDLIILGAGGKMGPTLARLARRAADQAGCTGKRIIAVSRFASAPVAESLAAEGVVVHRCDLLDATARARLPWADNVLHMVGHKFAARPPGGSIDHSRYWAINAYVAGAIAEQFARARIVMFSTGNVYPMVGPHDPMPTEQTPCAPVGEYAQSCLARERLLEAMSRRNGTLACLLRLNYAVELRYGVLVDLARSIMQNEPIDLSVPEVNFVWQGYANRVALRAFETVASPPEVFNLTGAERYRVRDLATRLAQRLERPVHFSENEGTQSLLSDASRCHRQFGPPELSGDELLDAVAQWVRQGGLLWNKPTRFQVTNGNFS